MQTLTLPELGAFVVENYTSDVLRIETLQHYYNPSEQDGLRRYLAGEQTAVGETPWIRQLRAHAAAGRTWRVLHAVARPLSDYVRYEMEVGYTANAAAGQSIRIDDINAKYSEFGDLLIVDREHVFRYTYDESGEFVTAEQLAGDVRNKVLTLAETLWAGAEPFSTWWAEHPQYHRSTMAA